MSSHTVTAARRRLSRWDDTRILTPSVPIKTSSSEQPPTWRAGAAGKR